MQPHTTTQGRIRDTPLKIKIKEIPFRFYGKNLFRVGGGSFKEHRINSRKNQIKQGSKPDRKLTAE